MAFDKSALGTRYTCYQCEAKFYDMNRDPVCPKCDTDQREGESLSPGEAFLATLGGSKKKRNAAPAEATEPETNDESDDDLDDDDEEGGDLFGDPAESDLD